MFLREKSCLGNLWVPERTDRRVFYSHVESFPESSYRGKVRRVISKLRHPGARSLESAAEKHRIDFMFPLGVALPKLRCAQAQWIPDFQHFRLPEFFPGPHFEQRNREVDMVLDKANHIVLSSESARCDACNYRTQIEGKLHVLPFVLLPDDDWFDCEPSAVADRFTGGRPFMIFPAQTWVHKEHGTIIQALAELKGVFDPEILVLCTGHQNDYRFPDHFNKIERMIADLGLEKHIRFLGLLPRKEQVQLMRASLAIIQPSRFEGWSALLEDAQCFGKPIIASDLEVHKEQNPPKASYFPVGDSKGLASEIEKLWSSSSTGYDEKAEKIGLERQLERGKDFARRFVRMAEEIVQDDEK